jgi:hypothetical protein
MASLAQHVRHGGGYGGTRELVFSEALAFAVGPGATVLVGLAVLA